jgi:hypothetical protein
MYLVSPLSGHWRCKLHPVYCLHTYANCTSESQSNARNLTYSTTTMQPSVLPLLDTPYMWGFFPREKIVCVFPIWSLSNSLVKVMLSADWM